VAPDLVRTLVQERLVACGNVLPGVRSFYWWEGEVQDDEEVVLFMETAAERVDAMIARLRELHPYDVPKIVVLEPDAVNAEYLAWARQETKRP
jgi:periplasmic divalent cation tolerance protein